MGCIEWQSGEVLLPTAAVKGVRGALCAAANELHLQAKTAAHDFWDNYAKHTRSQRLYDERLRTYMQARSLRTSLSYYGGPEIHVSGISHPMSEDLCRMLSSRPHKMTLKEIEKYFPRANTSSKSFTVGEGWISLQGRVLKWHTGHNKNVVERFYQHPLAQALNMALRAVKWTRATGGHSWGSDEYAEDAARDYGGNPVHTADSWGPLGERHLRADISFALALAKP